MPELKRDAVPNFAPTPGKPTIGIDDNTADWIESAIVLGTFAAGVPIAGTLINMQLNLLFKGINSGQTVEFWQQAQDWIQSYVKEEVEAALWRNVLKPQIQSIGQAVERIAGETAAEQFSVYNGTVRTTCDQLRDALHDVSKESPSSNSSECTQYFSHFISIALLDVTAWTTLIALDVAVETPPESIENHKTLYKQALQFYRDSEIRKTFTDGFWYWRNSLVDRPEGGGGSVGTLYSFDDNFYDDYRHTIEVGFVSGQEADDARNQYVHDAVVASTVPWRDALDSILNAFELKSPSPWNWRWRWCGGRWWRGAVVPGASLSGTSHPPK